MSGDELDLDTAARFEWKHMNASGGGSIHRTRKEAEDARWEWVTHKTAPVDEPPHPASLGIFRRQVTEWERDE